MILALTMFFLLMWVILQLYINIIKIKYSVEAKEALIEETYYIFEKLNIELKDYTIDYEEYYNRQMVWCDDSLYRNNFVRDTESSTANKHCDNFTNYGNRNSIQSTPENSISYYFCSSSTTEATPHIVIQSNNIAWSWCFDEWLMTTPYYQSYWQYKRQFRDVKNNIDFRTGAVWDNDDQNLGLWPIAIADDTNIKELYLISKGWNQRILFRLDLISQGDRNRDGTISWDNEYFYTLQMLKLRWFDAWQNHNLDSYSTWSYDGQIDTRTCDYTQWFICDGPNISNTISSWFRLPDGSDDWRVNILEKNLTITDRNINIQPNTNTEYNRNNENIINPYFTISLTTKLYGEIRYQRIKKSIENFQLNLQTTFNTRSFYTD